MSHYDKALKDAEDNLNSKANQMGRLKVEYDHNLQKLTDSYYPKMQPLRNTVYLSQSLQKWIELEIDWKSKMLAKMDMHGPDFSENLHMTDERAAIMATVQPKFDDSIKSLEALTPDDMKVLRKYEHPPDLVLKALDATMTLKGDPSTGWEDAKIMLADTYFFSFFIKHAKVFDKDHLDEAIVEKLEDFLMSPESEPDVVGKASIPCGAMIKWVRAVYEWAKTKKVVGPHDREPVAMDEDKCKASKETLANDVEALTEKLEEKRKQVSGAETQLQNLEEEYKQRVKELKTRYDATMDPLQETFFEAHHQFGAVYCSPNRNA